MWRIFRFMGYKVQVKVFDEGSQFGISEFPRISKMCVHKGNKWLLNYDRGWDFNDLSPTAYKLLLKFLEWAL
ncbi:hypothetical protein D0469_07075 [Peribacillus saganii]|uniref:DUF7678 domain-containing protein n=1 Tax=Peribacillus saganii TaxID=2303992 RepID=A0A372LQM8_9BACI|nr:hypothetical protein [Peribacillus saganii]RFU70356.1 hypothetical protein D0469_07075 [Peribacillus saganii]